MKLKCCLLLALGIPFQLLAQIEIKDAIIKNSAPVNSDKYYVLNNRDELTNFTFKIINGNYILIDSKGIQTILGNLNTACLSKDMQRIITYGQSPGMDGINSPLMNIEVYDFKGGLIKKVKTQPHPFNNKIVIGDDGSFLCAFQKTEGANTFLNLIKYDRDGEIIWEKKAPPGIIGTLKATDDFSEYVLISTEYPSKTIMEYYSHISVIKSDGSMKSIKINANSAGNIDFVTNDVLIRNSVTNYTLIDIENLETPICNKILASLPGNEIFHEIIRNDDSSFFTVRIDSVYTYFDLQSTNSCETKESYRLRAIPNQQNFKTFKHIANREIGLIEGNKLVTVELK